MSKLLPHTKRTSVVFIHLMEACPQLTNAMVIEALMKAGHSEKTASIMTSWFRARVRDAAADTAIVREDMGFGGDWK